MYCQFQRGESSAQRAVQRDVEQALVVQDQRLGVGAAGVEATLEHALAGEGRAVDQQDAAVAVGRGRQAEEAELLRAAGRRAPLVVVADRGDRVRAEVGVEERAEVAALDEDVRVEIEEAAVVAGEGGGQREAEVGGLGAPGVEGEVREDAVGLDAAEADPEVGEARDGREVLAGGAEADVEVAVGVEAGDLRRGEPGEAGVVGVAGEDDGPVEARRGGGVSCDGHRASRNLTRPSRLSSRGRFAMGLPDRAGGPSQEFRG